MDGAAGVLLYLHGMRRQRRYAGARTEHRTGGGHLEVEELDGRSAKPRRHELYLLRRGLRLCRTARGQYLCALPERQRRGRREIHGSYSLEASTIRGFYSTSAGSKAWSDSYEIGNLSGSAMTWTASHAAGDVQQFVRVETVPPGGARRLGRSALRRRTDVGRHLVGDNGRFGKTGSGLPGSGPFICLGIQRGGSFSEQSGRPEACHVRTQTNNRRCA